MKNILNCFSPSTFEFHDEELFNLFHDLKLLDFLQNFSDRELKFTDLPKMKEKQLTELIPLSIPRGRLKNYLLENYLSESNGWEINQQNVLIDYSKRINMKGKTRILSGIFKVGISEIPIAAKEIFLTSNVTREKVINEVLNVSLLRYKYIIKCFGCFFVNEYDNERAYIILEYCPRGDIMSYRTKNEKGMKLSAIQKLNYLIQIGLGMKYVHKKDFCHRDLKPRNILLSNDLSSIKICDFGTSKLVDDVSTTVCGTPSYLAPETFNLGKKRILPKRATDPKSMDIYGFGILMWSIWTGLQPYMNLSGPKKNIFNFLNQVHGKTCKRPDLTLKSLDDCPKSLIMLMKACWEKNPRDRPQSFTFIVNELQAILDESGDKKDQDKDDDDDDEDSDSDTGTMEFRNNVGMKEKK